MNPPPTPTEASRRRDALVHLLRLSGAGVAVAGAGVFLASRSRRPEDALPADFSRDLRVSADPARPLMAVARAAASDSSPAPLVRRAVEALGGMRRFVSRGDVVLVKPNAAWDRTPEQAANTNPDAVAETVRLCLDAGAARVIVTDVTIHNPRRCFERSGILDAAVGAGATIVLEGQRRFREVNLRGETLGLWPVFTPFLEADKIVNLPVAKHHSLTGVSLGLKNWYGVLGGERQRLHQRIHESLADLGDFFRPTLTILDAWRVLERNGPSGGGLADVASRRTVIAGTDPVAIDAWAAKAWWNLDPAGLPYLAMAAARGLGTVRFETLSTALV